jgi:Yip1 domain
MSSMEQDSIAPLQPSLSATPAAVGIWARAVFRPSVVTYQRLFLQPYPRLRLAHTWILIGAFIGGLIVSIEPLLAPFIQQGPFDTGLLLAIPIYALIATLFWAIFIGCVQVVARLLKGIGTYTQLACTSAAFSAPLIVIASVLASIPWSSFLSLCLYIYWLVLYILALQAVNQFSRARAIIAVLITLLLCGGTLLGIILIVT